MRVNLTCRFIQAAALAILVAVGSGCATEYRFADGPILARVSTRDIGNDRHIVKVSMAPNNPPAYLKAQTKKLAMEIANKRGAASFSIESVRFHMEADSQFIESESVIRINGIPAESIVYKEALTDDQRAKLSVLSGKHTSDYFFRMHATFPLFVDAVHVEEVYRSRYGDAFVEPGRVDLLVGIKFVRLNDRAARLETARLTAQLEPGKRYVVDGRPTPRGVSIWISEEETGKMVSPIFESVL
jgi:hypothetical protein